MMKTFSINGKMFFTVIKLSILFVDFQIRRYCLCLLTDGK